MILSAAVNTLPGWVAGCAKAAPMASILLYLAPLPTTKNIMKEQKVGDLPLLPQTMMLNNAVLWSAYGVLRKEPSVWGANGVGILLSIFYFLQFLKYAPVSSETLPGTKGMHIQGFLTTASIIAALAVTLPNHTAATIIGNIGIAFCILMFASPLVAMKTVIQTKSAESIPLPLTLASIACCFSWAVTGLKKMRDPVVYVPNLIGLVFGLMQLALKLVYGNGNKSAKDIGYAM